jgi:transposase
VLRLLAKRNVDIGSHRTRVVCRLHAALADLAPGGIAKELNASDAVELLARIQPTCAVEQTRHDLAVELLDDVRRLDAQLKASHKRIRDAVHASDTSLTELFGVGPIIACSLIGRTGDVRRFTNRDQFAAYNGTAPIEALLGRSRRASIVSPREPPAQSCDLHGRDLPDPPNQLRGTRLLRSPSRREGKTKKERSAR